MWRVADGTCALVLLGHEKGCSDVCWSACGRYLASASDDKNLPHSWRVDEDEEDHHRDANEEDDAIPFVRSSSPTTLPLSSFPPPADLLTNPRHRRRCVRVFSGHTSHVFACDLSSPAGVSRGRVGTDDGPPCGTFARADVSTSSPRTPTR